MTQENSQEKPLPNPVRPAAQEPRPSLPAQAPAQAPAKKTAPPIQAANRQVSNPAVSASGAVSVAQPKRRARIVAVTNQKGGVGKTTTTINLGACLALSDKKVLVVDFDPQGNATTGLGLKLDPAVDPTTPETNGKGNIYTSLINGHAPRNAIHETSVQNLHLFPSSIDLSGAEIELVNTEKREFRLRSVLEELRADYDFILIDSPPSLGLLTINVLTAADSVLIPLQCEYYALEGLSRILKTVTLVKKSLNPALTLHGILFTMFDGRTLLANQVISEVEKYFKEKIFKSVIPRNVKIGESPSHGKPIVIYDYKSKGADAYIDMTKEFLQKCDVKL